MSKKNAIFSKNELENLLEKKNCCVVLQTAVIDVLLLPCYLNDVKYGLWNALWRKLKTYDSKYVMPLNLLFLHFMLPK